jgi:hypothetical protein
LCAALAPFFISFSSPWPQALTTTANLFALATMMAVLPSLLLAVNFAPLTEKPRRPVRGEGVVLPLFWALYLPRRAGFRGSRGGAGAGEHRQGHRERGVSIKKSKKKEQEVRS